MRKPFERQSHHAEKPTLQERAAALKVSMAQLIRGRHDFQFPDQFSSASLPQGSVEDLSAATFIEPHPTRHDVGGGDPNSSSCTAAADGHAPHQECAMGRHESFDPNTAIPMPLGCLSVALPAPGSPEALDAFRVACQGVDAASRLSDADMEALRVAPDGFTLWTSNKVQEALNGKFSRFMPQEIEAARAVPRARLRKLQILTLRRELRMAEAAQAYRIHEIFALVYGDEPDLIDEDEAPAAGEPDPIFAAINEGKRLLQISAEAYRLPDVGLNPLPEKEAASDALSAHVYGVLLKTVPRTAACCAALVKFAQTYHESEGISLCEGNEALVSLIARSPARASPAPVAMADPRLVAMVEEWQEQRRKHDDPVFCETPEAMATWPDHSRLQREIYLYPARTVFDLLAKVPVLRTELAEAMHGNENGDDPAETLPGAAWTGLFADIERIAGAAPALAAADDADLIALGRAFDAAAIRYREAHDAANAADDRAAARKPERPTFADEPVTYASLGGLRQAAAEIADEARRLRADAHIAEISAALDAYGVECQRIYDEEGIDAANAEVEAVNAAVAAIAQQVAALPARTLAGVWVKVRIAAFCGTCDPTATPEDRPTGEAVLLSLYRDAPRLVLNSETGDVSIAPEASGMTEMAPSLADQILVGWRAWGDRPDLDESEAGEAKFNRLSDERSALIDAAEALPATPENILPKALASVWMDYVELWRNEQPREAYGTDGRLALDIDTAICSRIKTHYSGGEA